LSSAVLSAPGDELGAALDRRLAGPGPSLADLHSTAEWLRAHPDLLTSAVAALRARDTERADVAARSYWHPNGFAKVVLRTDVRYSVRLHVWSNRRSWSGDLNPHGHRWEFASWVLSGGLREAFFSEAAATGETAPGVYHRCVYGRDGSGRRYLQPICDVPLHQVSRTERAAGAVYGCGRTVIHAVDPIGPGPVATVVVQGPPVVDSTAVYLHPDAPREHSEEALAESDLGHALDTVLRLLNG
jgi:hypothetical protein